MTLVCTLERLMPQMVLVIEAYLEGYLKCGTVEQLLDGMELVLLCRSAAASSYISRRWSVYDELEFNESEQVDMHTGTLPRPLDLQGWTPQQAPSAQARNHMTSIKVCSLKTFEKSGPNASEIILVLFGAR